MKGILRASVLMLAIILLSSVVGTFLLTISYCLPTTKAQNHVEESFECFITEGDGYSLYGDPDGNFMLDNYTDAIMLSNARFSSGHRPLIDAILCGRELSSGAESPVQSFSVEYQDPQANREIVYYPRYWHGYLLFLKPLLLLLNYPEIRTINLVFQSLLTFICLLIVVFKKSTRIYFPAFLMLFIFQDIFLTSHSLQYSTMFYLYTIGTIFLLLFFEKMSARKFIPYYFLFMGILSSYMDFLTYPLVSYGIPVTVYLILDNKADIMQQFRAIIFFGLSWIFGYAGMWLCKGLVGSLVLQENILSEILGSVIFRTGTGNYGNFTKFDAIKRNIITLSNSFLFDQIFYFCLILLLILVFLMFRKSSSLGLKDAIKNALPFLLISASPFCWYYVLTNHSWIHSFFTFRTLYISVFSLVCMILKIFNALFNPSKYATVS